MTNEYYESAESVVISKARAVQELRNHGVGDQPSLCQFFAELGDDEHYNAQDVLDWLGY